MSCRKVLNLLTLVHYRQCVDDAELNARLRPGSDYSELPGQHVTINQLVAWNMAYFRKAASLTQEELGERLGWSKAIVSAAERSWDGKRVRQFTVHDVTAIAMALSIPIAAMFLPPEDNGVDRRYLTHVAEDMAGRAHQAEVASNCLSMHDLMTYVMSEPGDSAESPAMKRYRERYVTALNSYFGADFAAERLQYVENLGTEERILEHLRRLRGQYDTLREMLGDNDHQQGALTEQLHKLRRVRRSIPMTVHKPAITTVPGQADEPPGEDDI